MKNSTRSCCGARASHLVLGLAWAALGSACSGYYPLGETSDDGQFLNVSDPVAGGTPADAQVEVWLGPPDVTIDGLFELYPGTVGPVGDLDGDGFDEMAVGSFDFSSGVAFVHLRYGGPRPQGGEETFAFEQDGPRLTLASDIYSPLAVFTAGDVDADGYEDLMVQGADCSGPQPGQGAYLVYGGPERLQGTRPLQSAAVFFEPPPREVLASEGEGTTCSLPYVAGPADVDLDGDGFDDVLLARNPKEHARTGQSIFGTGEGLYVFYGRTERFSGSIPYEAADASFHVADRVSPLPLGDIDGDGLSDLLVSPNTVPLSRALIPGSFLLRGRAERWSGRHELAASATLLDGALAYNEVFTHGDLDGDGLDDVLLQDSELASYIFYGEPELFADGIDFTQADAVISSTTTGRVFPVGDLDGDGDDELLDRFFNSFDSITSNVAFSSGSSQRHTGEITFPEGEVKTRLPQGLFPDSVRSDGRAGRTLEYAFPAGDLDGDGTGDLLSTSFLFDMHADDSFTSSEPQLHIHYGTPASGSAPLR